MADYPRAPIDITHTTLSVAFLSILAVAAFWVVSPFLTSILWATIISVAIWPLLVRLQAALGGRRGLAVTIVTIAILLVVFVPVTLAFITVARNAQQVTTELSQVQGVALPGPPEWLAGIPVAGQRMSAEQSLLKQQGAVRAIEQSAAERAVLQVRIRGADGEGVGGGSLIADHR